MLKAILKVPATFADDCVSRDFSIGTEIKRTQKHVTVVATAREAKTLFADARYYETESKYMGREFFGLGRSAAATVKAIEKQVAELPEFAAAFETAESLECGETDNDLISQRRAEHAADRDAERDALDCDGRFYN